MPHFGSRLQQFYLNNSAQEYRNQFLQTYHNQVILNPSELEPVQEDVQVQQEIQPQQIQNVQKVDPQNMEYMEITLPNGQKQIVPRRVKPCENGSCQKK